MADPGIGIGIGEGLHHFADAIRARRDNAEADREKRAHDLFTKGVQATDSLQTLGYGIKKDPQSGHVLYHLKTNEPVQDIPTQAQQLFDVATKSATEAQALYPPHESNALFQDFRKWFGKSPAPPTSDPRAAGMSVESMAGEVPAQKPDASLEKLKGIKADIDAAYQNADSTEKARLFTEAVNKELGIEKPQKDTPAPKTPFELWQTQNPGGTYDQWMKAQNEDKAKKPLTFQYHPQTGGLTSITDPNNGETYDASNITSAPPEVKSRWDAIGKQQEGERKRKEDEQDKKDKETEKRQASAFENSLKRLEKAQNDALDRKDYDTAKKNVTAADNTYQDSLDRMATMDKNLESALKDPQHPDQQAMMSLVANHIGMTLSAQKGARINKAVWDEAISSAPWLQKVEARFGPDGYLSGVTLTPQQMHQMVDLAHEKVDVLKDHKRRVEDEYHDALSVGTRKNTPGDLKDKAKPVLDDDPLGVLK